MLSSRPGAVSTLSGGWALAITVFPLFFLFRGENKGPGPGHPHPPPPCGLTLSRESSMETARRENSSTTRAATRTPQRSASGPARRGARSAGTPTGPAASASQDEAPGGCGDRQGRGQRQTEGAEPPAWSLEGVPALPATPWGEGGVVSSSRASSQRPLLSAGFRAQGVGRGGGHSLGTAHEEVDPQEVVQDGDCAGPDEA